MSIWKVSVVILVSMVLAGYAAAAPLVYDDFESYSSTEDLAAVWGAFDAENPALVPALDTAVSHGGSQSMRLDSPVTSDWGVELGQKADTTDISTYNAMTAWVKISDNEFASTWDVSFELRDIYGGVIGAGGYTELWATLDWQQVTVPLDGEGDLTQLSQILLWFNSDPTTEEAGIPQFYVDDVAFVPEPATLAILGFGGLLLRRKK